MRLSSRPAHAGFTLVEMIAVIAMTAVLATGAAVFLRLPLQAYQDAQRRASISDTADTAFAVLKRDLQTALPNSVRVTSVGAGIRGNGRCRHRRVATIATARAGCEKFEIEHRPDARHAHAVR